jgi:UDP-4-amino-4-deoxy-L-arabinose formyltransferase/UDP-glucuronic acid dehydrogenase (UDP-4-keto-hexauronic acid decarboxylating)
MKFAALGRTHWLRDAIRAAVARGHQATLIGTAPAAPEYLCGETEFAALAHELGCDFFCGTAINAPETVARAAAAGAEVAIAVNWPTIIGAAMRAQFPRGIINAHAGDLPRFRGNACPNWAILAGETRVVVTLHEMAQELDAGPILLQRHYPLTDDTYIGDVYAFMTARIPEMFAEALDGLAAGTLTARPQSADPADSLRCYPRRPEDGYLDWRLPSIALARLVRASAEPFAGAFFVRAGKRVAVWRARAALEAGPSLGVPGQVTAIDSAAGTVAVLTGEGVLLLQELQGEHQPRTPAASLIRSTRERLSFDPVGEYLQLARRLADLDKVGGAR